jgi:hypothetical protein
LEGDGEWGSGGVVVRRKFDGFFEKIVSGKKKIWMVMIG